MFLTLLCLAGPGVGSEKCSCTRTKLGDSGTAGRELREGGGEPSGRRRQSLAKSLGDPGFQPLPSLHHRTLSSVFDWEGVSISFFTKFARKPGSILFQYIKDVMLMYTPAQGRSHRHRPRNLTLPF